MLEGQFPLSHKLACMDASNSAKVAEDNFGGITMHVCVNCVVNKIPSLRSKYNPSSVGMDHLSNL
jgi:hypothetical protein